MSVGYCVLAVECCLTIVVRFGCLLRVVCCASREIVGLAFVV